MFGMKSESFVDIGPPNAKDLSSKALVEEMEKRGMRPSGFPDEDIKALQKAFDSEWEGEKEERIRQREDALLKKKQEEEAMRLQRYSEKQLREEEDAMLNDPDAAFMLKLIQDNRAPETLILRGSNSVIRCLIKALGDNQNVKRLDLIGCGLTDDVGAEIGNLLRENSTIQKICLDHNSLGPLSCLAIAAGLRNNCSLIALSLEHNTLTSGLHLDPNCTTDDVLASVVSSLALASATGSQNQGDVFVRPPPLRYTPDFVSGSLSGNYHELETSEVPGHISSLPSISQGGTSALMSGTARVLADAAESSAPDYEGIVHLSDVLEDHPSLRSVNLFHSGLGPMGGKYIAEAVAKNTRLTSVMISITDGVLPSHVELVTKTCQNNRHQLVEMQMLAREHALARWEEHEAKLLDDRARSEESARMEWHLKEQLGRVAEKSRVEYAHLRQQRQEFADFVEIQKEKTLKKKEDELAAEAKAAAKAKKASR